MKTYLTLSICGLGMMAFTSCQDMNPNAQRGAIGGAVVGGIIGHQSGNALEGAAIGAAAGGVGGHLYDESKKKNY